MAAPGAQGPQNGSRAVCGSQEAVFGAIFLDYIKRVTALQASLDYQSQPTTGKSPKNTLKSLHIDETMVGLSLALLPRA